MDVFSGPHPTWKVTDQQVGIYLSDFAAPQTVISDVVPRSNRSVEGLVRRAAVVALCLKENNEAVRQNTYSCNLAVMNSVNYAVLLVGKSFKYHVKLIH